MEKKAEAKKELDKLSLRKNSKDYYIRLIDGAVSLNEVDEVLEMAKSTPDGSKLLLSEKELTKEKLQKINNLTDQEKEKFLEDIYYAMEVRELDEIIKLAQSQGTENLDKAKETAKKEIAELEYLGKENSSKIIEKVNEKTLIEEVEKTLENAKKLNEEIKAEKELNETKDSLVAKVKELKYLTEAKTNIYIRGIQNAKTIELAENIYNRAVEENSKLEQIAKDKEKEEFEEKLKIKKEEAIKIIEEKQLTDAKHNLFINRIENAKTIEEIDNILSSDLLKGSTTDNEKDDNDEEEKPDNPDSPVEPEEPIEEKDFSNDKFRTIQEHVVIEKIQEIAEYEINKLDISEEDKEQAISELSQIETATEIDDFIEKYNLDIIPIVRTIALNTVGLPSEKDDSRERMTISFVRSKIHKAENVEEIKDIFRKIM